MHLLMVAWETDAWPRKKAWSKLINSVMHFIVPLTQCLSRMQNIDGSLLYLLDYLKLSNERRTSNTRPFFIFYKNQ